MALCTGFLHRVRDALGRYKSVSPLEGVKDFVGQVLPSQESKAPGKRKGIVGDLLRRAKDYDVRLYQVRAPEVVLQ